MPRPGGPESEHRDDAIQIRISRRDLLRYGGTALGGAAALAFIQRVLQGAEPRPQTPPPPAPQPLSPAERAVLPQELIEKVERERGIPTPTPERKRDILWQTDFLIPHRTVTGKTPDAFTVSQDIVFFLGTKGAPIAYKVNEGKLVKEWKDQGYVYGADGNTAFIVAPRRLYMWDVRTGKEVASQNIEADQTWFMDWPLWYDSKAVHIQFVNGYQTTRRAYTTADRTTGAISIYDGTILYQGEKTLLVGRNASLNNTYDLFIADARTGTLRSLPIERSNQFFAFSDILSGSRRDMLFVIENSDQLKQQVLSIIDLASGEKLWSRKLPDDDFYEIARTSFREEVVCLRPKQPYKQTGRFFIFDSKGVEVRSTILPNSVFLDAVDAGDLGKLGMISYPTLGKTKFFNSVEWEDDSLVINRVLGVSQGILVALYQERGQPPVLYRIDIKNQKRLGRPIRIEQGIGNVIVYEGKIVMGLETRNVIEVVDLDTGETVKQVSLPKRVARIFPTKVGSEKVVFAQIGFAPEFPGMLGRSQKEEKGSLVVIRL